MGREPLSPAEWAVKREASARRRRRELAWLYTVIAVNLSVVVAGGAWAVYGRGGEWAGGLVVAGWASQMACGAVLTRLMNREE